MIVYQSTKSGFASDVLNGVIADRIEEAFVEHLGRHTSESEVRSWQNSMQFMDRVVADPQIPSDCGISIEYQLPLASKRIDFIISGQDDNRKPSVIIIELKQWKSASKTDKDGIVVTRFEHGEAETIHPSYQAWSYATMLKDYNTAVQDGNISLHPCAFLHNYVDNGVITHPFYSRYTEEAPPFLKNDAEKLRSFIKRFVKYGDDKDILYQIENGRLRPSKHLADCLSSMISGKPEFKLLDEQKTVYETALALAKIAKQDAKQVLIVEGGPGSGKTVLAINLIVELTNRGSVTKYVSKNSAPPCGNSMEPRISDGDYCVFSRAGGGSREGKIVLVQHFNNFDPDYAGSFSIKQYHSIKSYGMDGQWQHEQIQLLPLNKEYDPIMIDAGQSEGSFIVVGEFIGKL